MGGSNMSKQKTVIEPGQVWRDKRNHERKVNVLSYGLKKPYGGGEPTMCVVYEQLYQTAFRTLRKPVKEKCFRGDYELVSAPTEAQKEQR
jgi:hypothetical protein